ncbi:uncharacterized protein LOC128555592 [Mercenaria mercenaria]|uniref:uncharacterized protein LOC128555592 n=1 Tax=Mercenaria mercenaria TaxID=6596 RepID=UPI00234F539A|nr:uncharacterized protein LOC128555592 [Mercenaria mercenaria]XP_053394322.1 uncharacterized protein LOC128555592 [Mercenaria mercenaria]XP_053394323.1 uncharacterized protein LOC128555592 [Mercenaria mercenaria]
MASRYDYRFYCRYHQTYCGHFDGCGGLPGDTPEAFEAAIRHSDNRTVDENMRCIGCSTEIRVKSVSIIVPGEQISWYGGCSADASYKHHAIVKKVKNTSGTCITMELVEFDRKGFIENIYKTEKTFNLRNDTIFLVQYQHSKYTAGDIVSRAESMLPENSTDPCKFGIYNPETNNCEHFATWCVVGKRQSFQTLQANWFTCNIG